MLLEGSTVVVPLTASAVVLVDALADAGGEVRLGVTVDVMVCVVGPHESRLQVRSIVVVMVVTLGVPEVEELVVVSATSSDSADEIELTVGVDVLHDGSSVKVRVHVEVLMIMPQLLCWSQMVGQTVRVMLTVDRPGVTVVVTVSFVGGKGAEVPLLVGVMVQLSVKLGTVTVMNEVLNTVVVSVDGGCRVTVCMSVAVTVLIAFWLAWARSTWPVASVSARGPRVGVTAHPPTHVSEAKASVLVTVVVVVVVVIANPVVTGSAEVGRTCRSSTFGFGPGPPTPGGQTIGVTASPRALSEVGRTCRAVRDVGRTWRASTLGSGPGPLTPGGQAPGGVTASPRALSEVGRTWRSLREVGRTWRASTLGFGLGAQGMPG